MSEGQARSRELASECRTFTRYLIGIEPTEYIVGEYVAAHETLDVLRPADGFDRFLLRLGRGPSWLRGPAAAFARVHAPRSALQNKLVTLLAILETAPVSGSTIDAVPSTSVPVLIARLAARGTLAAVSLIVGTVLLVPLRWLMSPRGARA